MGNIDIEVASNGFVVRSGIGSVVLCENREDLHKEIDKILTNSTNIAQSDLECAVSALQN